VSVQGSLSHQHEHAPLGSRTVTVILSSAAPVLVGAVCGESPSTIWSVALRGTPHRKNGVVIQRRAVIEDVQLHEGRHW